MHINAEFERLLIYLLWQQPKYLEESHYEYLNYWKKVLIKTATLLKMQ